MSKESSNDSKNKGEPDGKERRNGPRRIAEDRRESDRVVAEEKPRRKRPGRREADK